MDTPSFSSQREADLFSLANHYRAMVESIFAAADRGPFVSSNWIRDFVVKGINEAPHASLLSFQVRPVSFAPKNGKRNVLLVGRLNIPMVAVWNQYRGWCEPDGFHIKEPPVGYVPIGPVDPIEPPVHHK